MSITRPRTVVEPVLDDPEIIEAFETFAGPGGWDEGNRLLRDSGFGRIYITEAIEWDEMASATARAAGHARTVGDVRDYQPRGFRLHIASPPCQGFSIAGLKKGIGDSPLVLEHIMDVRIAGEWVDPDALPWQDERTELVLEPLRNALTDPDVMYLAWEQVPAVLVIWEACAAVLRDHGWSVVTGNVQAEQYGVPQTRRRAILLARRDGKEARLPVPTHSRFHTRDNTRLDPGVLPWVSMAEALNRGLTERPSFTVCGGGTAPGGAEPYGNAARQTMEAERERGAWLYGSNQAHAAVRHESQPAPTVVLGGRANAVTWQESGDLDPREVKAVDRVGWKQRSNFSAGGDGTAAERGRTERQMDQPSVTVTAKVGHWVPEFADQSGTPVDEQWPEKRPSTVVAGRDLVQNPGATRNATNGSTKSRNDGVRINVQEAGILQSFPADYPWTGNKGQQHQQAGDAVPPLLTAALLKELCS